MNTFTEILKIFAKYNDVKFINTFNKKQLRQRKIPINDILLSQFKYSQIDKTKTEIISEIKNTNDIDISDQAIHKKINNIDCCIYEKIWNEIFNLSEKNKDKIKLIAIDGTFSRNNKHEVITNLGVYDITNKIPIYLDYSKKRNNEVKEAIKIIEKNPEQFKNSIIVCDRGYFSHNFFDFLIRHKITFIIRVKGNYSKIDPNIKISKTSKDYNLIMNIRKHTKIIKGNIEHEKIIKAINKKTKTFDNICKIKIKDTYSFITNLTDINNNDIIKIYNKRWSIETFFMLLKSNFKFSKMNEINETSHMKIYYCNLIILYLEYFIENYLKHTFKKYTSINKTNLIKGIFDILLKENILRKANKKFLVGNNNNIRSLKILFNIQKIDTGIFKRYGFVKSVGLYGSCAKGTNTEESDIDLWIKIENSTRENTMQLTSSLLKVAENMKVLVLDNKKLELLKEENPLFYHSLYFGSIILYGKENEI